MTPGYPIVLDLTGRAVLVVGGGRVALRRARALAEAGATIRVVAPTIDPDLHVLAAECQSRAFGDSDLDGQRLVHACTDDPLVNAAVAAACEARGIWCVRADDATASPAHVPAVARHDDVSVSVHSGGDPRRSVRLRDAIAVALHAGSLGVRRFRPRATGSVALVGGGPGDPGLVTVRGLQLLMQADVVVVDKLAPRALLDRLDPDVEIIDAGKSPHRHNLTQQQINEVLVERASRGLFVVRLKGGDPFVFGRGGEEALACRRAGVPVEVVPGVTSAIAGPALAGIPVTHRGVTQDVTVVSAHVDPSHPGSTVDWQALADGSGTIVVLMGVGQLAAIADELVKRGRPGHTPTAIVSDASMPTQRVVVSTLARIADEAAAQQVEAPAVVVVGDVVRLRELLGSA